MNGNNGHPLVGPSRVEIYDLGSGPAAQLRIAMMVAVQGFAVGMERLGHGIDRDQNEAMREHIVRLRNTIDAMEKLRQGIEVGVQQIARSLNGARCDLTEAAALAGQIPAPEGHVDEWRKIRALLHRALGALI